MTKLPLIGYLFLRGLLQVLIKNDVGYLCQGTTRVLEVSGIQLQGTTRVLEVQDILVLFALLRPLHPALELSIVVPLRLVFVDHYTYRDPHTSFDPFFVPLAMEQQKYIA